MDVSPVFEPLLYKKRELQPVSHNIYCVSRRNGEIVNIEANTAYEAFKLCGLKDAIKIERLVNIKHIVLNKKHFIDYTPVATSELMSEKEDISLLEKIIRERKQVLSPDDMIKIVADLSSHSHTLLVTDPTGVDLQGDGFDEIIPSNSFTRQLPAKKAESVIPPSFAVEENTDIKPAETIPEQKALSQDEIEKLLNG